MSRGSTSRCDVHHTGGWSEPLTSVAIMSRGLLNMQPAQQCPICLSDVVVGGHHRSCGHVAHWRCISRHVPFDCPVCRCRWDHDIDDRQAEACMAADIGAITSGSQDASPQPRPRVGHPVENPRLQPRLAPTDVMFLCCQRRGPPPEFVELPDNCMSYSPNWVDGSWHDA